MKQKFPTQSKPLFEFKLNANGEIIKTTHVEYQIQTYSTGVGQRTRYIFKRNNFVISKTDNQINKYLSGYFYTFDDDLEKAAQAIRQYYEKVLKKANETAKNCKNILAKMNSQE